MDDDMAATPITITFREAPVAAGIFAASIALCPGILLNAAIKSAGILADPAIERARIVANAAIFHARVRFPRVDAAVHPSIDAAVWHPASLDRARDAAVVCGARVLCTRISIVTVRAGQAASFDRCMFTAARFRARIRSAGILIIAVERSARDAVAVATEASSVADQRIAIT